MCGIVALLLADRSAHCSPELYDALTTLQHRGQDAAGMTTCFSSDSKTKFNMHKGLGLVGDVFSAKEMACLLGNAGVGHCRYPTVRRNSSPTWVSRSR